MNSQLQEASHEAGSVIYKGDNKSHKSEREVFNQVVGDKWQIHKLVEKTCVFYQATGDINIHQKIG